MLLGLLIGIGFGIVNLYNIEMIVVGVCVFVVLDVGIGIVSDVVLVMELGCDVVLLVSVVIWVVDLLVMVVVMVVVVIVGYLVCCVGWILKCFWVQVFSLV